MTSRDRIFEPGGDENSCTTLRLYWVVLNECSRRHMAEELKRVGEFN